MWFGFSSNLKGSTPTGTYEPVSFACLQATAAHDCQPQYQTWVMVWAKLSLSRLEGAQLRALQRRANEAGIAHNAVKLSLGHVSVLLTQPSALCVKACFSSLLPAACKGTPEEENPQRVSFGSKSVLT